MKTTTDATSSERIVERFSLESSKVLPARRGVVGVVLAGFALACLVSSLSFALPPRVRFVLAALSAVVFFTAAFTQRLRPRLEGEVIVTRRGVFRVDRRGRRQLMPWNAQSGVTVLADCARSTLVLAFTSADVTRYLSVSLRDAVLKDVDALADRAFTVVDADLRREDAALSASAALRLLGLCDAMAPGSTERLRLSGVHGESILVLPFELRVCDRSIDLAAPFEWQPFVFHETLGAQTTLFQATWVGQAGIEVLLVAPMPGELSMGPRRDVAGNPAPALSRIVQRDLKLLVAQSGVPPQGITRVAIERFFMLPLRSRLDRAPFARRAPLSVHKVSPERRLS